VRLPGDFSGFERQPMPSPRECFFDVSQSAFPIGPSDPDGAESSAGTMRAIPADGSAVSAVVRGAR